MITHSAISFWGVLHWHVLEVGPMEFSFLGISLGIPLLSLYKTMNTSRVGESQGFSPVSVC